MSSTTDRITSAMDKRRRKLAVWMAKQDSRVVAANLIEDERKFLAGIPATFPVVERHFDPMLRGHT